ncbi:NUDIX hydrolase [Rhizobium calliandrae]|uniref:NUDIX hydrolase n=1 Tax=Rhizobium calliandrae TaxID=1312182 RepID=A0ABT7KPB2_9HYPH|nr:NUDIX hydrolase [Rhizobium calliandrae]MDL2410276.1 NUDIX hydrolase [Rhizobium calliandrae]
MNDPKLNRKTKSKKSKALLGQLAAIPEKLFAGAFLQQYGALCFRYRDGGPDIEVLVITSRDSRRWVIPKGWPMRGMKPFEAAAIEAWEEAGARGTAVKKPVGRYTYLKDLDNGDVGPCVVDVFQIEVLELKSEFKERGQRILEWVAPDEAARRVREIELKSLLIRFEPRRQKKRAQG